MAKKKGTNAKDKLTGTNGIDTLLGLDGNDTLYGRGGDDTLKGDDGNDKLYGESGDDTLRGGTGNDKLYGGTGHDRLFGEDGNDTLDGGTGFNILDGGDGNDMLLGNQGINVFRGGDGIDTVSYAGVTSKFVSFGITILNQVGLSGGSAGDSYDSIEIFRATKFADSITLATSPGDTVTVYGGDGDDFVYLVGDGLLEGEDGDDTLQANPTTGATLRGGEGFDTLLDLGPGVTRFLLEPGLGFDHIYNFDVGSDKLQIIGADFGIGPTLDAAEFTTGFYADAAPAFRYDSGFGSLYFDFDGTASDFGEILVAVVYSDLATTAAALTLGDFEVI